MPAPSRFQYASISDKRLQTREPVSSESPAITANYTKKEKRKKIPSDFSTTHLPSPNKKSKIQENPCNKTVPPVSPPSLELLQTSAPSPSTEKILRATWSSGRAHNGGGGPSTIAMERRFGSEGYRAIVGTAPSPCVVCRQWEARMRSSSPPVGIFSSVFEQQHSWNSNSLSLSLSSFLYCCVVAIKRFREVDQLSNPFVIDRREDRGAIAFEIDKLEESFSIFTIDRLAASTREISEAW